MSTKLIDYVNREIRNATVALQTIELGDDIESREFYRGYRYAMRMVLEKYEEIEKQRRLK